MRITALSRRPADGGEVAQRIFNRLFDHTFNGFPFGDEATLNSSWAPACDVFEDKDGIRIITEIPGVKPEDVKISIENNTLTIRGEKKQVAEEKTERVHRYERSYGVFERSIALPSTVDPEKVVADYENRCGHDHAAQGGAGQAARDSGAASGEVTRWPGGRTADGRVTGLSS